MLPITSVFQCYWIIFSTLGQFIPNYLCYGDGQANKNTCFGDSGGPLIVQKHGQENWTLAGLVSGLDIHFDFLLRILFLLQLGQGLNVLVKVPLASPLRLQVLLILSKIQLLMGNSVMNKSIF